MLTESTGSTEALRNSQLLSSGRLKQRAAHKILNWVRLPVPQPGGLALSGASRRGWGLASVCGVSVKTRGTHLQTLLVIVNSEFGAGGLLISRNLSTNTLHLNGGVQFREHFHTHYLI